MGKIKIAQIGVCHEHASGKITALRRLPELFEIVGVVDDNATSTTPKFSGKNLQLYEGLKWMTEEEVLNYPGLQAVTVEVPNNELVPTALRCMEHNLAMHMDKPAGEDLALYRKLLDGCRERNLPFQMGFMFRGNPAFQFCIAAIREKLIGEVFEIEADMNHNYGGDEYQEYIGKFRGGIGGAASPRRSPARKAEAGNENVTHDALPGSGTRPSCSSCRISDKKLQSIFSAGNALTSCRAGPIEKAGLRRGKTCPHFEHGSCKTLLRGGKLTRNFPARPFRGRLPAGPCPQYSG